jgi:hypothetical protein
MKSKLEKFVLGSIKFGIAIVAGAIIVAMYLAEKAIEVFLYS